MQRVPRRRSAWLALLMGGLAVTQVAHAGAAGDAAAAQRARAVFVLGEDREGAAPFHGPARLHYLSDAHPRSVLVDTERTLAGVREALGRMTQRGEQPWGEVVLVAHGSEWLGLAVPLFDATGSADPETLALAQTRGEFPPLPDTVIDARTIVRVESCGVGRRADLLELYSTLLGGFDGERPRVLASTELVEFRVLLAGSDVLHSERLERPYVSRVVKGDAASGTAVREAMTAELQALGETAGHEAKWLSVPVSVHLQLPRSQAALLQRRPSRLAQVEEIAVVVRQYGLEAHQLDWSLRCASGSADCDVLGRASILSVSAVDMPLPVAGPIGPAGGNAVRAR